MTNALVPREATEPQNRYDEAASHADGFWASHRLIVRLHLRSEGVQIEMDDKNYIVSHLMIENARINPIVLMIDQMFKERCARLEIEESE